MIEFDMQQAYREVRRIVDTAPDLTAGMEQAIAFCESIQSDMVWRLARQLDYAAETQRILDWAAATLRSQPPRDDIQGLWFGLTNSFQQRLPTCAMYLAGSREFDAHDPEARWVLDADYIPVASEGICVAPSRVFREFYKLAYGVADHHGNMPDYANLLDYVLCLSFAGLTAREICRRTPPELLLGGRDWRGAATGFDDGDFLLLGCLSRNGLERFKS